MITQTTPALQSPQAKNKILSTDRCLSVIFHDSNCPPPLSGKSIRLVLWTWIVYATSTHLVTMQKKSLHEHSLIKSCP